MKEGVDAGVHESSGPDEIEEAFNDAIHLDLIEMPQSMAEALGRQRAKLADLHPGRFRQELLRQRVGQGEAGPLGLARDREGDNRAGMAVEEFMADHEDRAPTGLFPASGRLKIGPVEIAP